MNKTSFELGFAKGEALAMNRLRDLLLDRLRAKFAPLTEITESKVQMLDFDEIIDAILHFQSAQSLAELGLI